MIGIVDYGIGNLHSVQRALELIGASTTILREPETLDNIDKLVLPGVGAFANGMEQLRQRGWIGPIRSYLSADRPFLGICLGMQLLFEGSEEDAPSAMSLVPGLAVIPGKVVRFKTTASQPIKIPHMGWNAVRWTQPDPLLRGLEPGVLVYFVHSYYPRPTDVSWVSAVAEYPLDRPFCASIWRGHIWATQFHPEKSQRVGLQILANFALP